MNRIALSLVLAASICLTFGCDKGTGSSSSGSQSTGGKKSIVVIPKGTTHVFWQTVDAGAQQAGQESGYEVIWKGPLKEDEKNQQIAIVQQFVTEDVGGIALAPLDKAVLVPPVESAK